MPVVHASVMSKIIRDGMDHYWRAVYSDSDEGLSASELEWKRGHERDMDRMEKKFGAQFDEFFGKRS